MKHIIFWWLLFLSGLAYAGNVNEQQARKVAASFLNTSLQSRASGPALQMVLNSENLPSLSERNAAPAYYVFDDTSGKGFVIVSGDDAVRPILAYSFEEDFPQGTLPPNLQEWLKHVRREINDARRNNLQPETSVTQAWNNLRAGNVVVELETARWDQAEPYNQLCPTYNGMNTYTGCTATALAIAMRYHQWPGRGVGTLSAYTTDSYGIRVNSIPLGHPYQWDLMPLDYTGNTPDERNAVATLMRDCAVMLQSDFGPVGSMGTSASTQSIPTGLTKYMGYDKGIYYTERGYHSTDEWYDILKEELDSKRPVIYDGFSPEAGHAFVLDGYTTDNYFSVNWGWSGTYNGYFLLDALEPEGQGAGGGAGTYNLYQGAVIGMQKNIGGTAKEIIQFAQYKDESGRIYNGLSVDGPIETNVPFTLYAGLVTNMGVETVSGQVKCSVTDHTGKEIEVLNTKDISNLSPSYGIVYYPRCTITKPILGGYRIRAFFRSSKASEWTLIRGNEETGSTWELLLTNELSIEESTSFTYNKTDKVIRLTIADETSVTLSDTDGTDLSGLCRKGSDGISVDTSRLPAGSYILTLQKGQERKTLKFSLGTTGTE